MVTNKNKCVGGLIRIHVSSIVNEVIKTVSSQFFFLRKYFERTKAYKRKITNFAACLCFCWLGYFWFDLCFCMLEIFL